MSKTKRLLSVTLAIAMIILSAFSAFAEDTEIEVETLSGTVTAEDVTVEPGVTEVEVPVTIAFENDNQVSPHGQFDIAAEGATLESATFKKSDNANFTPDETVPDGAGLVDKSIYVDADGVNTENGRVIVESDVSEGKQPSVSYVTVEVVLEFTVALTEGQVIIVDISNIAATNLSEASWDGMVDVDGKITVEADVTHEAAADWSYDDTNHWHACVVEGCTEHTYDVAAHTMSDYVANEDGTTETATCTANCGYSHTKDVEVVETTLDDVFPITITPTVSTFTVNGSTGFTREGDTSSALCYNFVAENYGTMQSVGLAMTIDGTVPTVESNAACFETTLKAGSSFITGANYAKGISYTGMNVMQFDTDVKYVGFISYLDETTQSVQYLYTSPIIVNFADCLKEMADDELATKVLKMYNDVDAGIGLTGTYAVSEKFSSLTITYDVDAFSVNGSTSFVKADANSGEYSNYVAENYGTVGSIGVALSIDGTDPTVESNAAYFETTLKAGSSFLTAANYAKGLSYTGMNITQLGTECKFAIFSQYTSTDGSIGYVYVDTISVKLIDILRGIEDNEAVTNIVEIYDAVN